MSTIDSITDDYFEVSGRADSVPGCRAQCLDMDNARSLVGESVGNAS